jgi:hypothetical protein
LVRPIKNLSGSIATGDSGHFGTNDLDQINNLLTGQDQGGSDPLTLNTLSTFRNQKLALRNPANTFTSTVINPAVTANSNFQFNTPYDYYIFIDPDDGNKIKARNGRTGAIDPAGVHATNADVVIQYAIDQLSVGSTGSGLWTGGKYGSIFVGPGTFTFHTAVILKSNIAIIGSGRWSTKFTWPDNLLLGNHNQDMFKSSQWDTATALSTVTASTSGDTGVILKDFEIYGNWKNNIISPANTATSTLVAGIETATCGPGNDSWGHGIAFWGYSLHCENLFVHGCPGAGIIIQNNNSTGVFPQGGFAYPLGTGTQGYDTNSYFTNVRCWANGRQGLLLRAPSYVYNYWSYWNGEAGLDVQNSANFFASFSWIDGIECFIDGVNHGDGTSRVYDPLGFEVRIAAGCWLSNAWIEAPSGMGDCLMIGVNGTGGGTGYQINGGAELHGNALRIDSVRSSGIFLSANYCDIDNAFVFGGTDGTTKYTDITPMTISGSSIYNNVELAWTGFVDNALSTTNGVVLLGSPSVPIWGNNLRLFSINNTYALDNENANNHNVINATVLDLTTGTKKFLKPGGVAFSTNTKVTVDGVTSNAGIMSHNGGTATLTGNGTTTVFNIPHLLFAAPTVATVRPKNAAAVTAGVPFVTADATNVIVNWTTAPPTSTMTFWWDARVTP